MIDLNRVLNQSPSSERYNIDPRRLNGRGLNLRVIMAGLFAFLLLASPLLTTAQQLTATLSGVVEDSSGAVVPNATVTVTQTTTNAVRTVQSDASGNYVVTSLPAGTYNVSVSYSGFETYVAKNVVLNVAEKRGLNIQLKTGSTSTTVTVEAAAATVDTETSAQAGTITGVQIRELELAGRNFEQLVALQPGVVSQLGDETSAGATAMSVNGARVGANNWTVDGSDINDSGSNLTVINAPNVDAIQEFTLARGTYDAGYGRSGGGQVVVATKAGTSTFHGTAYEFLRNTALDANEWFNKRAQFLANEASPTPDWNKRPVNHHNVYGFTIGGPVYIPDHYNANKNKTFFFWSEEWRKISSPGGDNMPAATQANLGGYFTIPGTPASPATEPNAPAGCITGWTVDPSTGNGSGTVQQSCYSANSQVYLTNIFDKYPANSGDRYVFSYSAQNNFRDDIARVDHYFSDKVHLYVRYMNDTMPVDNPEGLWAGSNYPGLVDTLVNSPGKNVVGNLTWTINPKVVNEFEFAYAQGTYFSEIKSGQFATSSAINGALTNQWSPDPYGKVPAISINGITGFSGGSAPWHERNLDRTYFDNLSFNLGRHTLRTGFQIQQMIKTENAVNGEPNFSFNSWGDFLLGNVSSFTQTLPDIIPDLHFINTEAYVQDDWKVTHRLTLNLGVRWSRLPSVTDVKNTLSNFDPHFFNAQNAPQIDPTTGEFVPGQYVNGFLLQPATYTNGIIFPKGTACSNAKAISPMVTCSPFGAYVAPNYNTNFAPRFGFSYDLTGTGKMVVRGGFGVFYDRLLNGIWEQNAFVNPPLAQSTTINNTSFDNIHSGTVSVNYGPNLLVAAGNPAFFVPRYSNYNLSVQREVLPSTVAELAYVGALARHLLGQFDMNQPTIAAVQAAPTTQTNALRPFLGYATIRDRGPFYTNNYNSLQASLNHHSHGLQVGLAYTWSKDLTTQSADRDVYSSYQYDFKLDYGPASYNQPHTFTASYVYDLPFYTNQAGLLGRLAGGWEVSGITQFLSGQNFSVSQPYDPWDPNGVHVGTGRGGTRPDQIAPVRMTKTVDAWFSTDSFATAVNHFGSERSGSLLGPGFNNWDLAAIKNTKIAERLNFQLRGEFFNAWNHESFGSGGGNGSSSGAVDNSLADSSFGQVTSGHSPRRIQVGAKFIF